MMSYYKFNETIVIMIAKAHQIVIYIAQTLV